MLNHKVEQRWFKEVPQSKNFRNMAKTGEEGEICRQ